MIVARAAGKKEWSQYLLGTEAQLKRMEKF